ncbi:hypothetical protein L210DRAFT_2277200 [Boletus edulis BED1]|uniref:Uncharacterized protein n=1 Tax=Boletus edulis BED1 TaxID=1328754 RepID=A0AAD4BS05_BOLED|nr:hypothetical protein L210DRAFT_2277200 [Boletus edulis BED1]
MLSQSPCGLKICLLGGSTWPKILLYEVRWQPLEVGSTFLGHMRLLRIEPGMANLGSTGLAPMGQTRPVFDPLRRLPPEEVCWIIMDHSFACEVNDAPLRGMTCRAPDGMAYWLHAFPTIYSSLHLHALRETNPQLIPTDQNRGG